MDSIANEAIPLRLMLWICLSRTLAILAMQKLQKPLVILAAGVLLLSLWQLGGWVAVQRLKSLGVRAIDADLAAMAATPAWCTLAMTLPEAGADFVDAFLDGFLELADVLKIPVAVVTDNDGDTTAVEKKYAAY